MNAAVSLAAPLIIASVCLWGLMRGTDVFAAMAAGAGKGLAVLRDILPAMLVLFPAVYMLRASGLLDALSALLSPALSALGIPPETVPILFLRPFTGSGALAAASDIISSCGPDSLPGRTAAVMLGSSETTFYVASVYFGAAGVKKTRWAIPAALCADAAAFISASLVSRALWG
jgi:spore maturation protein B